MPNSTGSVGKLPRYLRHNRDKSIILPRYYIALATISTSLSYTKIVKIAAIGSVFTTTIHQNAFAAGEVFLD